MFWLLLSSAYPKSRTLFLFLSPLRRYTNKSWEGAFLAQVTQSGQKDIPHHRTSCPVYKLGELPGRGASRSVGMESGIWSAGGEYLYCASLDFLFDSPSCSTRLQGASQSSVALNYQLDLNHPSALQV